MEVSEFCKYPMVGMFAFLRNLKAEEDAPAAGPFLVNDPSRITQFNSYGLFAPATNSVKVGSGSFSNDEMGSTTESLEEDEEDIQRKLYYHNLQLFRR